MKRFGFIIPALLFWLVTGAQSLPRIIVLATGGTIAGTGQAVERASYTPGKLPVEDLIGSIPQIKKIAEISGEQVASIGSQDMNIDIWLKLNERINEIFKHNEADGIVITHGTDTQEETSYFLNLTVRYNKPVVITGSMRPATAISADGPKNLYDAITVAADPASEGRGVLVVFNESIFDGREVVKVNTTKVNGFMAPNQGPLGQVYDGKVHYYQSADRKANVSTPFSVAARQKMPRVEIVYAYAGASPDLIRDLVDNRNRKVDGLVIAGVGNGNFSKGFYDAIAAAVKKGIVICRSTRCLSGRVTLDDEIDDNSLGTIVADDLNPQKARILLMLGLTKTRDLQTLQDYFFEY